MSATVLTLQQARNLHLAAQGLLVAPAKAATRAALRTTIARMALLQIDTIHVVSRSPYLVLHARLGHYPRVWLDEALANGHLFETWAHEACFAPIDALLLHRAYNRDTRRHWGLAAAQNNHAKKNQQLSQLLAHIEAQGPVKSSDFERTQGTSGAWWGWKDEKRWLETLFATGELMVARRENFHRVYDLSHRVAPQALAQEAAGQGPQPAVARSAFLERSVAALGITQARWIHDYFRMKPRFKDSDLDALVGDGTLLRVAVEGWVLPGYVHHTHAAMLKKAAAGKLHASHTSLLSPFDPVVWDRERASNLFDFDYRLECYTPEPLRIFGYFVLPILCCGEIIGRLDTKAHRKDGVFEVKTVHAQRGAAWTQSQVQAVAQTIVHSAAWHDTPTVRIGATHPARLKAALSRAIRALQTPKATTEAA